MGKTTGDDIQYKLEEINNILGKKYVLEHPKKERDWRTYEQEFAQRIRMAMKDLDPLVNEAVSTIRIVPGAGHPHSLTLEQRVKLLLIKQLVSESNRMFANMLAIFSMLSGIDVSYKTIERLYSDEEVIMAVHNLHTLILGKKDITNSNATGDGTGYSLTVKKNYESYAQKLKDHAKENPGNREEKDGKKSESHKKRLFAYSFAIMDLKSRMYIAFGSSMKSERSAYDRAMKLLSSTGIEMDSIRLDRYYSSPSYMDKLGETKVFVIPKKNSTLNGSLKWKNAMKDFVENTMPYLEQYHQRSNSESGFAADKKMLGWNIAQRRDDRIDNALFCTGVWHNLFNMGRF
ncbi:MAG: transposase [Ferroplasma sp. Type II]|uniref:transposase n=1 Tax=Ferroplasma sp. Type II TaxID=261388 RepID=UPI0003896D26|nr:transposase [Ferroplasma sp. Type II]EQB72083.1 MAG: transposase [Ferroplasma sp. Type II]